MLGAFEIRILQHLQRNGRASVQEVSEAVGLSPSPCWRRIKRLQEDGFIKHYMAILDQKKLGLHAFAYVQISLVDHTEESIRRFGDFVRDSDQIIECASITGDFDFLLKVAASDPEALEAFIMKEVLRLGVVRTTATNFVLRQMKSTGPLPLDAIQPPV